MMPAQTRYFRPLSAVLAFSMTAASVSGCAQVGQLQESVASGIGNLTGDKDKLPIDPADVCKDQREEFAKSQSWFTDQIVSGALLGGAGGAALGAAGSAIATGKVNPWVVVGSAAAGALTGASLAYYKTRAQDAADKDELARNSNSDLTKEGQQIDHTTAAFARLRACRFAEARRIKNEVRNGRLDRTAGLAQIDYQHQRFDEELAVARTYGVNMSKRNDQFRDAAKELRQDRPPTAGRNDPTSQAALAATGTIPEKRSSYDKSVDRADANSKLAFNLDNNANLTWLFDADVHA
jgi:hypothetical protein